MNKLAYCLYKIGKRQNVIEQFAKANAKWNKSNFLYVLCISKFGIPFTALTHVRIPQNMEHACW